MALPTLIIAGITLPLESRLAIQQTLSPLGGSTRQRMQSGALFSMTHWRKWAISLAGSGWVPAPLLSVDYSQPYQIHCIEPMAFRVGEALPPGWSARTDFPEAQFTGADGIATRLLYPILTVMSDPPELVPGRDPTWKLNAEEV